MPTIPSSLGLIGADLARTLADFAAGALVPIALPFPGGTVRLSRDGADIRVAGARGGRALTPVEINRLARLFAEADRRHAAAFHAEEYDLAADRAPDLPDD